MSKRKVFSLIQKMIEMTSSSEQHRRVIMEASTYKQTGDFNLFHLLEHSSFSFTCDTNRMTQ